MTLLIFFSFPTKAHITMKCHNYTGTRPKLCLAPSLNSSPANAKTWGTCHIITCDSFIQVEPSPITPFKALSGPSIYQQLFLFGNRDTDRSPCSNLIKTRLNFYTTLAKSYKHCKLTLNTSYKKKICGLS